MTRSRFPSHLCACPPRPSPPVSAAADIRSSALPTISAQLSAPGLRVVRWVSSDGGTNWKDETPPVFAPDNGETRHVIEFEVAHSGQVIDGFGGCFNERGWESLSALSEPVREQVLRDLFAPEDDGCRFTLARTPIGASDYAMDWYSLCDTPEDYELRDFSIARDRKYLLPFIHAALRHQPALQIWGSPWCPPAWMKINRRYDQQGGETVCRLRDEARVRETYARYFARYLEAYRAEGVPVYAVHVQNEPAAAQVFPSCLWNGEELLVFLKHHLLPLFERERIPAEVWLGTINHGDVRAYAGKVFADPTVRARVTGLGYQWDGKHAVADAAELYPEKKLMQTESECGNGSNDKAAGLYTYSLLVRYLKGGANSYLYWNLVLDQGGYSTWSWKQNSLICIERYRDAAVYNFEFHVLRHLSRFVRPGARRLLTRGKDELALAFLNPDGSAVLVVHNPRYTPQPLCVRPHPGGPVFHVTLPADSLHTFVLSAA